MGKWEIVRLGDVCRPKQWKTIAAADLTDDGYPVYGANGKIGFYNEYTHAKATVLVTCRGATCGTINVCEPYSYVNGNAMALDNLMDSVDIGFLSNFFTMRGFADVITGSAQPQIIRSNIERIEIPLPPLPVQQQIANTLDRANALIEKRKAQIEKLDLLIRSQFVEMFGDPVTNPKGWEMSPLSALGTFKNGMNFSRSDSGYSILCLGVGDFRDLSVIDNVDLLSSINLNIKPSTDYLLADGDIVFVRSNGNGELIGRSVVVRTAGTDVTFSGFCIRFRKTNTKIDIVFLNTILHNKSFKSRLLSNGRGVNIQNLNQQMLSGQEIMLPPLFLQTHFANFVRKVKAQKSLLQQSLSKLEQSYKSLMQKCFRGEIF